MSDKEKEKIERILFADLITKHVMGTMEEILKGAPIGVCEELGRIWDKQSKIPVGVLFQRPKFEEYEAMNRATAGEEN